MENLPPAPDRDEGDHVDVDHDEELNHAEDHADDEDDDHDPEDDDDDHDGEDLGQVSLSSSSPLIALVSDTKVGRSATLASLIVKTLKQTNKQKCLPRSPP